MGCRTRGRRWRPGAGGPGRSCGAGWRSAWRSRWRCWGRSGSSPACSRRTSRRSTCPGLTEPSEPGDLLPILWRNSLVLALHATACVAGFIAGASMPIAAAQRTGFSRWIHVKAGEFAILFVCAVTLFSLSTQALYLGFQGSTIAYQLHISDRGPAPQRPPARDPGADRALPAARRLADRQPPRRVEPAARRHLRHRPDRDPRPRRRGDGRGLRLAPHPRSSFAGRLMAQRRRSPSQGQDPLRRSS